MKKDKLLALAGKVGFVIDSQDQRSFRFEAIGYRCAALLFFRQQSDDVISMQLFCGFGDQPARSTIEAWNNEMRFVKARTSPSGQLILEMDLIVPAEMSADHLKDAWRIWNQLLARVERVFGGAPSGRSV